MTIHFQSQRLNVREAYSIYAENIFDRIRSSSELVFGRSWLDKIIKKDKPGSNVTQSNHFESNFVEAFEIDRWSFQLRLLDHQNKGKKNGTSRCDFGPRYKNPIAEKIPLDRAPFVKCWFSKKALTR